jgi:hypothetical protein
MIGDRQVAREQPIREVVGTFDREADITYLIGSERQAESAPWRTGLSRNGPSSRVAGQVDVERQVERDVDGDRQEQRARPDRDEAGEQAARGQRGDEDER